MDRPLPQSALPGGFQISVRVATRKSAWTFCSVSTPPQTIPSQCSLEFASQMGLLSIPTATTIVQALVTSVINEATTDKASCPPVNPPPPPPSPPTTRLPSEYISCHCVPFLLSIVLWLPVAYTEHTALPNVASSVQLQLSSSLFVARSYPNTSSSFPPQIFLSGHWVCCSEQRRQKVPFYVELTF